MPSLIQSALLIEALGNIPAIIALMFYPSATLSSLSIRPSPSNNDITPIATLFARFAGALILALTPHLFLAMPDRNGIAETRRVVYLTLASGEVALIPALVWEAFRATDEVKRGGGGGFSRRMALGGLANMVALLLWRGWVLGLRPRWLDARDGGAVEVEGKGKGKGEGKGKKL